jgi:hypothetical protein
MKGSLRSKKIKSIVDKIVLLTEEKLKEEYASLGANLTAIIAFLLVRFTKLSLVINRGPGFNYEGFLKACRSLIPFTIDFAPTKDAAKALSAKNLFSTFRIPYEFHLPDSFDIRKIAISRNSDWGIELASANSLILCEANMVNPAQLDLWSRTLGYSYSNFVPFSNSRMIFISEPLQLHPIMKVEELKQLKQSYNSEHFISSKDFQQINPTYIEVDDDIDQCDVNYLNMMRNIRNKRALNSIVQQLNNQVRSREAGSNHVIDIVPSNDFMNHLNKNHFDKLMWEGPVILSERTGKFVSDSSMPSHLLHLKEEARVMFTENDPDGLYQYGQLGSVISIEPEAIVVQRDDGQSITVKKKIWKQYKSVRDEFRRWRQVETGTMKQFPLQLGYAISYYKSVGLRFDHIYIPNYDKLYKGHLYIALSRAKSLNGVSIYKKISKRELQVDDKMLKYCQEQQNVAYIQSLLKQILSCIKEHGVPYGNSI